MLYFNDGVLADLKACRTLTRIVLSASLSQVIVVGNVFFLGVPLVGRTETPL